MRSFLFCLFVTSLALVGCRSNPEFDCPGEGAYVEAGLGRYCAYGVVIGGFDCPPELPNRYDFEGRPPDVEPGFVCSDRPTASRDEVPSEVCRRIPACEGPGLPTDAGVQRDTGPERADADGPLTCGTNTCDPGQICFHYGSGVDGGTRVDSGVPNPSCLDVPADCPPLYECDDFLGPPDCSEFHDCFSDIPYCSSVGMWISEGGRRGGCFGI